MMKRCLTIVCLVMCQLVIFAQNHYKIRLDERASNTTSQSCFAIQLSTADGQDLNLAGQNYRLYYDAEQLELKESNVEYLLSDELYHNFTIKNYVSTTDATGVGYLPFNQKIGFLNLSVDLLDYKKGGAMLSSDGAWKSTCQVCFNQLQSGVSTNGKIIWAREDLTSSYATAFVEIAEWLEVDKTEEAIATEYEDLSFSTSTNFHEWETAPKLFPVPTKDFLWIEQAAEEIVQIEIWSIQGNLVYTAEISKGITSFKTDMKPFANGMYQARLVKGNKQYTQLIEKIR